MNNVRLTTLVYNKAPMFLFHNTLRKDQQEEQMDLPWWRFWVEANPHAIHFSRYKTKCRRIRAETIRKASNMQHDRRTGGSAIACNLKSQTKLKSSSSNEFSLKRSLRAMRSCSSCPASRTQSTWHDCPIEFSVHNNAFHKKEMLSPWVCSSFALYAKCWPISSLYQPIFMFFWQVFCPSAPSGVWCSHAKLYMKYTLVLALSVFYLSDI